MQGAGWGFQSQEGRHCADFFQVHPTLLPWKRRAFWDPSGSQESSLLHQGPPHHTLLLKPGLLNRLEPRKPGRLNKGHSCTHNTPLPHTHTMPKKRVWAHLPPAVPPKGCWWPLICWATACGLKKGNGAFRSFSMPTSKGWHCHSNSSATNSHTDNPSQPPPPQVSRILQGTPTGLPLLVLRHNQNLQSCLCPKHRPGSACQRPWERGKELHWMLNQFHRGEGLPCKEG